MTNVNINKIMLDKIRSFSNYLKKENSMKQKQNRTSIIQNTLNNIMFKRLRSLHINKVET